MMHLLPDEKDVVLGVADRWKAQYCNNGSWGGSHDDSEMIYKKLAALQRGATANDVAAIIGNDSWVGTCCNECGRLRAILQVGEDPMDYESRYMCLCSDCIERIQRLVASTIDDPGEHI